MAILSSAKRNHNTSNSAARTAEFIVLEVRATVLIEMHQSIHFQCDPDRRKVKVLRIRKCAQLRGSIEPFLSGRRRTFTRSCTGPNIMNAIITYICMYIRTCICEHVMCMRRRSSGRSDVAVDFLPSTCEIPRFPGNLEHVCMVSVRYGPAQRSCSYRITHRALRARERHKETGREWRDVLPVVRQRIVDYGSGDCDRRGQFL